MNFLKKLLAMRNAAGLVLIGGFFAVIGLAIVFAGAADGSLIPLLFAGLGLILLVVGIRMVIKELKEPIAEKAQYDRVDLQQAPKAPEAVSEDSDEEPEEFVYHFTGKMNQDQVMKTMDGEIVYEALCDKITMVKDTSFRFVDHISGTSSNKMISHTVTTSSGLGNGFQANISSTFRVDGTSVWDVLAQMGYGFRFRLNGIAAHYDVTKWSEPVGSAECAGTGLMNPKYQNNPLGKMPTKGIYRVKCKRSDIPGMFLICFALSRTEETLT